MLNTPTRIIDAGGIQVKVYEPPSSSMPEGYTLVYRTESIEELDRRFGLKGKRVIKDPVIDRELEKATDEDIIGNVLTARILRLFAEIAKETGTFVGVRQDEFERQSYYTKESIEEALGYKDDMNGDITYLTRVEVGENQVLFPANLKKQNSI